MKSLYYIFKNPYLHNSDAPTAGYGASVIMNSSGTASCIPAYSELDGAVPGVGHGDSEDHTLLMTQRAAVVALACTGEV